MKISRRGLMFVMSSPSGAGKTTIAKSLLAEDHDLCLSVSVTTRDPRPGEIDGVDYIFKTPKQFEKMQAEGDFLETAKVFGNLYGTPKKIVEERLSQGFDVLFDIDWQGTQQLAEKCRPDMARIFILPPSTEALYDRLKKRGTDNNEIVKLRMNEALSEISHWPEYDYVIVNNDLDECLKRVRSILISERLKRSRQVGLVRFVNGLREQKSET